MTSDESRMLQELSDAIRDQVTYCREHCRWQQKNLKVMSELLAKHEQTLYGNGGGVGMTAKVWALWGGVVFLGLSLAAAVAADIAGR